MKELLRSYYLSKLIDAPLNKELVLLENAIIFIENILKTVVIKVDKDRWSDYVFYFIEDKCFFEYNTKNTYLYYTCQGFYTILNGKYGFNVNEINQLVKVIVEEHFKNMEVTPQPINLIHS